MRRLKAACRGLKERLAAFIPRAWYNGPGLGGAQAMSSVRRKYHVGDQPVPGYRLATLLETGNWDMEYWEAEGPDDAQVLLTIILVHKEIQEGLLGWFSVLPLYRRVVHHHLVSVPDLWLKTADGRVLRELPSGLAVRAGKPGSSPPAAAATQLKMLISELNPVEAVEIEPLGTRPRTLRDRLRECREGGQRGIPGDELVRVLEGPAKALDFLHQPMHDLGAGLGPVVHGGINPRNLVIAGSTVKVADWANLTKWKTFEVHRRVTPSAVVRGIAFSAPEALAGTPGIASDQYSLAVVYAALRTSALPYPKGANPSDMMDLIRRGELDFSKLPKPERRVVSKATALDPEKRWPTCSYLVRALGIALSP